MLFFTNKYSSSLSTSKCCKYAYDNLATIHKKPDSYQNKIAKLPKKQLVNIKKLNSN